MPNRGPKISPTIRALIMYEALNDKRPRRVVAVNLQKQIERLGESVPGEETLLRLISEDRNNEHPEDQPWSIATLKDFPIVSPDVLPSVLKSWAYAREHLEAAFTIREAKWVARLCYVIKDTGKLTSTALMYAREEVIAEITGDSLDSFEEDLKLFMLMTGEEITDDRMTQILSGPKYGLDRKEFEKVLKLIKQARDEIRKREVNK